MKKTVGIGHQDFEKIRTENVFYVDKTAFIREWWENADEVTLITRPRRFGKTLNMSMLEKFFSVQYAGRGDLFQGLAVWEEEKYRKLQGTYPVISLSFASIKESDFFQTRRKICQNLANLYSKHRFLIEQGILDDQEYLFFQSVSADMDDMTATMALHQLSLYLSRYYGKKVIILLDEYDTPMQEAYIHGYWDELVSFTRSMFNSTFKTNPYLERAIMTGTAYPALSGITRVSKESIFSDLNNLKVVTTTSEQYSDCFGFTEEEVFAALDEYGLSERKQEVKTWYDGFIFGKQRDIYNPWSIINYLDTQKVGTYWANSSSNSLVGKLIREGSREIKQAMENLLFGKNLVTEIDEQIVYSQLDQSDSAIWSLLLASGYLKVIRYEEYSDDLDESGCLKEPEYELALTNLEVVRMFRNLVRGWFGQDRSNYNDFIKALLLGDVDAMNDYMNRISELTFSSFDTGKYSSKAEPEKFYHGFVLGLMVELAGRYVLTSNRESGFGRYDVMLEPLKPEDDGMILEFKVFQSKKEKTLEDTVERALKQIEEKRYEDALMMKGIPKEKIRKYGFAFSGKYVMIGEAVEQAKK